MFINLGKQETGKINHLRTFFLGKCLTHLDNFRCCSTHACTIAQMRDIGKAAFNLLDTAHHSEYSLRDAFFHPDLLFGQLLS